MKTQKHKIKNQKGQVLLLVVLIMGGVMVAASTIAGYLTVLKIRQSSDVYASARAIYAADAGIEWDLYDRMKNGGAGVPDDGLPYNPGIDFDDLKTSVAITRSTDPLDIWTKSIGTYNNVSRAFELFFGAP